MGVYIPGIKMPVHCGWCSVKIDPDNRQCIADGHVFEETLGKLTVRRDSACPLVPVPEPHGRLGDLDAFIQRLNKECKAASPFFKTEECRRLSEELTAAIIEEINEAPTIIPAEEET